MTIHFTHAGKELFGRVVRWDGKIPTVLTPYGLMLTVKGTWSKEPMPKEPPKKRKIPKKERESAKSPMWADVIGGNYRKENGSLIAVVPPEVAAQIQEYETLRAENARLKADKHLVKVPKRHQKMLDKTVNSPEQRRRRLLAMDMAE